MARVPPNAPRWGHRLNADIDQVEGIAVAALGVANAATPKNQKGVANGYASLDGSAKIPDAQIPAAIARDAEVTAAVEGEAAARAAGDALLVPLAQKGANDGVAPLDGGSRVPQVNLPGHLDPAQLGATYESSPTATGRAIYLYGNSYSILAAGYFTAGGHYSQLAASRLGAGSVTSYGVSGRRILDVVGTLLDGAAFPGCNGIIAAGKWPGVSARPGLVILESFINDGGHYPNMTGVAIPAAITTAYRDAMKVAYRAALALMSSESRVENASATTAGTWTRAVASGYASADFLDYTTANGATATYNLTPPQSGPLAGKVYLSGFTVDPAVGTMAAQEIRVDGVLQTSRTPAPWEQYVGHTGTNANIGPDIIEVTLPIDGAAHSVELKHVGSAGHLLYDDLALIPSIAPNPIAVMGAEHPIVGTPTWTAAQTGVYTANNRILTADLKTVIAEFPHAVYVTSTMTANGIYSGDGLHPNDRGMAQRANDLIQAVRERLRAHLENLDLRDMPNGNFPII